MATQIQFRRGTTSGHSSFTGAAGEITIDTDKDTIIVHDGSTTGGANEMVTLSNTQTLTNKTLTSPTLSSPNMTSPSISGTAVTATAAEINTLDGITATVSELNIMDGVTATTAEINKLDGVTATTTELNYLDITTLGTSQASKAVTADSNGDVTLSADLSVGTDLSVGSNVTITGNLTVNGSTVTNSADNLVVNDALIELNNGAASNASDLGLIMERGSTGDNAFIGWDESADKFKVGTTTATGASSGDLTISTGTMVANIEGNVTGNLTGDVTGDVTGNLTGNVTGNTSGSSGSCTGNSATATKLATARTIGLSGDVSGSVSFDGSANATITATVADDSHNHVTGNIDGLAEYIADTAGAMWSSNTESGVSVTYDDADNTLDINVNDPTITLTGAVTGSATMTNLGNVSITTTATSDPTITLAGDLTGSCTLTNLGNATLTATVAANSVALGTDTTGNYMSNVSAGAGIDVTHTQGEGSTATIAVESDLRGDVTQIGQDTNDYYAIGTTAHNWYLDGANDMRLENDGDLHVDGDLIAYSTTVSDERLKTNIQVIDNALEKVNSLRGVTFHYTMDGRDAAGLIAQEVEKVLPSAIRNKKLSLKQDDGIEYKTLQYDQTIGLLVEAIKELSAKVDELENK